MAAPLERGFTAFASGLAPTSPAGTQVGDLVVVFTATSTTVTGVPTHTLQSGFTEIGTQSVDDGAIDGRVSIAYRVAVSSGANTYQAYTASTGTSTSGIYVIQAGTFDVGTAPTFAGTSSTTNGAPNPPAVTGLTGDFMVFAVGVWCYASATANTPTAGANYTLKNHLAGSAINDPAYATRSLTGLSGASEDPAAYSDNTAPACTMAATFAIKGVVSAVSLTGTVSATGTLSGGVSVTRGLSGTVAAGNVISGNVSVTRGFIGSSASVAGLEGVVSVTRGLSGSVTAIGAITGNLIVQGSLVELQGTLVASCNLNAGISIARGFSGALSGSTSLNGEVGILHLVSFSGTITSISWVEGAITRPPPHRPMEMCHPDLPLTSHRNCCGQWSYPEDFK